MNVISWVFSESQDLGEGWLMKFALSGLAAALGMEQTGQAMTPPRVPLSLTKRPSGRSRAAAAMEPPGVSAAV